MNFKFGRFFYLTFSFIFGAFFLIIGLFGIVLPWSTYLQKATTNLVLNHTLILSLFGLGFALAGISIFVYAIINAGKKFVYIRTGSRSVQLDEALIEQCLQQYWKKQFPGKQIPFYTTIRKQTIQIVADLPALPEADQDAILERVKKDFAELFGEMLGYPNEVHFIAHFKQMKS